MASLRLAFSALKSDVLLVRGGGLAALQIAQMLTGLAGQLVLLARWSPNPQTDLFLLVNSIPSLTGAFVLVGGLEMTLPSAYHRVLAKHGQSGLSQFLRQLTILTLILSMLAALISGIGIFMTAAQARIPFTLSLWIGFALGIQTLPMLLSSLWRGLLVAQDRLFHLRLALFIGSLLTTAGYALLPGDAIIALPLALLLASIGMAWVTFRFAGLGRGEATLRPSTKELRDETTYLFKSLLALSLAAGLIHLQILIERSATLTLGTGYVAGLAVASRGWDALLAVIVSACIMPAYPQWAQKKPVNNTLLHWSLRRTVALSFLSAVVVGGIIWIFMPTLNARWSSGAQAGQMALALLPRFLLLSSLQPLILKHYAQGITWPPVIGSALGVVMMAVGTVLIIPHFGLTGLAVITAVSVLPGWLYLGWREWRQT